MIGSRPSSMKRILVVEDDPGIARVIFVYLEYLGVEVHYARTLDEASTILQTLRPDCLLLDMILPDGTGTLMHERVTDLGIPVVVMSMHSRDTVQRLIGKSKFSYVCKPFELRAMRDALWSALSGDGA